MNNLRLKFVTFFSRTVLWLGHGLRSFWLLITGWIFIAAFILLGLNNFLPSLFIKVFFLLFTVFGVTFGTLSFQRPTQSELERRLTKANGWAFNPFNVLNDRPAHNPDDQQALKWKQLRAQAEKKLRRIRPVLWPRPGLFHHTPYRLFPLACIALLIGVLYNGQQSTSTLQTALLPDGFQTVREGRAYEFWLTPPEYTGLQPILLNGVNTISAPEGSTVNGFIKQGLFTPKLMTGDRLAVFNRADNGGYTINYSLDADTKNLVIIQGLTNTLIQSVDILADEKPIASIVEGPDITPENDIKIRAVASDDLGLNKLIINIAIDPLVKNRMEDQNNYRQEISLNGDSFIDREILLNMADHPWAGFPVRLFVSAIDSKGQTTIGKTFALTLPERRFDHPVAQQLAKIRKELFVNNDAEAMPPYAAQLFKISQNLNSYNAETDIYMGLIHGAFRLLNYRDGNDEALRSTRKLLWDLALRIDGGSTRIAAENLQKALQLANQALQNPNLTEEQFDQIRRQLEQAVNEYMQSLMRELQAKLQQQGMDGIPEEMREMMENPIDAGNMMQELQDLLQNGSRAEIAKALSDMQKMVEQLQNKNFQPMSPQMMQAMQDTAAIKEIITRQENLLGETLDLAPTPSTNKDPFLDFAPPQEQQQAVPTAVLTPLALSQDKIEKDLEVIQDKLEKLLPIDTGFITRARREMDAAEDAMLKNKSFTAIKAQERAIVELKQGMKQTMEQMMQSMGRMITLGFGPQPGNGEGTGPRDPFGRPAAKGRESENGVKLSVEEKRRRIQDIRDAIIDKSDQRHDDPLAEDYFEKLLERF